jgi:lysyl-tRNA synthetase class II
MAVHTTRDLMFELRRIAFLSYENEISSNSRIEMSMFVPNLPKELVPLAKLSPDDPTTVEVFECCINGQEISPGYTEQTKSLHPPATRLYF